MRSILLSVPGRFQSLLVIVSTIVLAFLIAFTIGMFFDASLLAANADIVSSIFEVVGTLYAILLTFTLWGVWQNFTEAGKSVQDEAYALVDLVHIIEASQTWDDKSIRQAAINYSTLVVNEEWPMLKSFTNAMINLRERNFCAAVNVIKSVQSIKINGERDATLFNQALTLMNTWLNARRTRILIARGNSVKALWPLLFIGACVIFAFHGLFVAKTFYIWGTLLFGTSLIIGTTFYLIFALDCPFDGSLSIDSEPFTLAINILKKWGE